MLTAELVEIELARYEHPLFHFSAETNLQDDTVLIIRLRDSNDGVDDYRLILHERDVAGAQFPWNLQRLLYDCMHDYITKMFIRTPQSR